jgi:threonine dehydratase
MPAAAPISKIHATENYGAEVVLVPGTYDDAAAKAQELAKEHGYTFAHPFDDENVIAGQGTIGIEILEQLPEVEQVVVPIGGGGLIAGIALAIKTLRPSCRIIGVQAAGAPSMYKAVKEGQISTLSHVSTIADGIAVKRPGDLTYQLVKEYVDDVVVVDDNQVAAAIVALMEDQKTVAEGAGACAVAAVLSGQVDAENLKTVCVVSGGNVDMTTLSRVINKGLVSFGRICQISVKITDKPGGLVALLQTIAQTGANVVSVTHARQAKNCDVGACVISMGLETHNHQHIQNIREALAAAGYDAVFK